MLNPNNPLNRAVMNAEILDAKLALSLLGFEVFPGQVVPQRPLDTLDAATAKAIGAFQSQRGLPATGVLDQATAVHLDVALEEAGANAAYGLISAPGAVPAAGLRVELYDWDLRRPTLLGEAETRADGFYLVRYSDQQVTPGEIASADMYLRVTFDDENGQPVVTESAKHFQAGRLQRIDLTLPRAVPAKESEVERYLATLLPLLDHARIGLAELTDNEVLDVAAETGIPTEHVAFMRRATVLSMEHQLVPHVFYSLFRQGLPTDLSRLLAEKPSRWREAFKAALAERIIPTSLEATLDSVIERLSELAVAYAFNVPDEATPSVVPLGAVLATSTLTPALQRQITRFVLLHEGDKDPWLALAESGQVDAPTLAAARFAVDTHVVLGGHLGTLKALQSDATRLDLNTARDLARLTPADWKNVAARAGSLPGDENSIDRYAEALADQVERAFPTAVIAQRMGSDPELGHPELMPFLDAHPDFDLLSTTVDDYLDGSQVLAGVADKDGLRARLKTWQRTALIAPDAQRAKHTEALMRHGFTSAYAVQRAGIGTFKAIMQPVMGPEATARAAANAEFRADLVGMTGLQLRDWIADRVAALPGWTGDTHVPDWARLFGSLNTCHCEHCGSMYGPAAYLVDLLEFMKDTPRETILAIGALDVLFARRPDIQHLKLNCANANIALPYIDLVNEILEAAVAGAPDELGQAWQTRQPGDEGKSDIELAAELRAWPRHELPAAYAALQAHTWPWSLPFEPDEERVRGLTEHLRFELSDLYRLFGRDASDIARVELGLGRGDWALLTAPTSAFDRARVWGTAPDLQETTAFMRQADLNADELQTLVRTWFLSEDGAGRVELNIPDGADPCDFDQWRLSGLTDPMLDQIHRLLRLQRRLGWALDLLDGLLRTLGRRTVDLEALLLLARAHRVAREFGRPLAELVDARSATLQRWFSHTEQEVALFARFHGHDTHAELSLPQQILLLERWIEFRETGADLRELAFVLSGQDQIPAVFTPTPEELHAFLDGLFELVQAERAAGNVLADASPDGAESPERLADLIRGNLAGWIGLDVAAVDASWRIDEIRDFVARPSDATRPDPQAAAALLVRWHRLGSLLRHLNLPASAYSVVAAVRSDNGFLDPAVLLLSPDPIDGAALAERFNAWLPLARAAVAFRELPRAESHLFDWLGAAGREGLSDEAFFTDLETATGWSLDPATGERYAGLERTVAARFAESISGSESAAEARRSLRVAALYPRIATAVGWMRKWRITPDAMIQWSNPATATTDLSAGLQVALRARQSDDAAWYRVLTPINDRVRERKREVLLAALLAHGAPRPSGGRRQFSYSAAVYAHYLIDPEMTSCMLTTRIVQATAAVQLFAQRILQNLEIEDIPVPTSQAEEWHDHWSRWPVMKSYRIWEANRKVLFYPENWLYPELRDNKSPLFVAFENALLQDELTARTVERAYDNFLTGLHQVARLDIRSFCIEEDLTPSGELRKRVMHLFARTYGEPHLYYYRRRDLQTNVWTSWEKVELNIEGEHLIPVVHNGQLMLFWALLREKGSGGGERGFSKQELGLSFSRYQDGRWASPRTSVARKLLWSEDANRLTFRVDRARSNDALRIVAFSWVPGTAGAYLATAAVFRADACADELELEESPRVQFLPLLRNTTQSAMGFHEANVTDDALYLQVASESDDAIDTDLSFLDNIRAIYGLQMLQLARDSGSDVSELASATGAQVSGGTRMPRTTGATMEVVGGDGSGRGRTGKLVILGSFESMLVREARQVDREAERVLQASRRTTPLLRRTPGQFRIVPPIASNRVDGRQPFVFQDAERSMLVSETTVRRLFMNRRRYRFELLQHSVICGIVETFRKDGFDALLRPRARVTATRPSPLHAYEPNIQDVATPYPVERIDFDLSAAYGLENSELYFHTLLLVATRLTQDQKYAESQRWFQYIFDPTDTSTAPSPARFWRFKPFFDLALNPVETVPQLLERIASREADAERQVDAWRKDPFNPQAIARLRPVAYMKATVMAYLDNLIAWADELFREDRRESINEAVQLYLLASELLGPRPVMAPPIERPDYSYADFEGLADEFGNIWLELESRLPVSGTSTRGGRGGRPIRLLPYFCLPPNEKLLGYWDTLADRLFKIRHCQDIEGRLRNLPLFDPPIDPGLLVRARAAGVDLRSALRTTAERPHYRYVVVQQKALEFCGEVRALGSALLSAMEKRDAEALGLLRSTHEQVMLREVSAIRDRQVDEARESLEALRKSRLTVEKRVEFYSSREFMSAGEIATTVLQGLAHEGERHAQALVVAASIAHLVPQIHATVTGGSEFGGQQVGDALKAASEIQRLISGEHSYAASLATMMSGYERRRDDWQLQTALAERELVQIDKQILAAEIRLAIAEAERENHSKQIDRAAEVDQYLRGKFTNQQLYVWMTGQLSALHYQAYQLALGMAQKAEAAARYELGTADEPPIVNLRHSDGTYRYLTAGEALAHDLRRLDAYYLERNARRLEITSHFSLRRLDGLALWNLRAHSHCTFTLPAWVLALDFPGLMARRIKSVSVSIPSVVGPYTGVHGLLELTAPVGAGGRRMIATSSGQGDAGVFQLDFRDERFLPFEGVALDEEAGTTWTFTLPGASRPFDYDTISDLVLHIQYTADPGGSSSETATTSGRFAQLISVKHDFPDEAQRLLSGAASDISVTLDDRLFPYVARRRQITSINRIVSDDASEPRLSLDDLPEITLRAEDATVFLIVEYQILDEDT